MSSNNSSAYQCIGGVRFRILAIVFVGCFLRFGGDTRMVRFSWLLAHHCPERPDSIIEGDVLAGEGLGVPRIVLELTQVVMDRAKPRASADSIGW